jgi:ABC-type multidrug transport system ATPase subunit
MIEVQEIRKSFLSHKGEEIHAVRGLSFKVERGEIFGLLGPNGAGKTTTLRMLAGLMTPSGGRILVEDEVRVDAASGLADTLGLKSRIGFLTANTGLYARLSPREVLAYVGELRGLPRAEVGRQTEHLVGMLGMREFSERRCEGLSTGQKQRVQIARTLIGNPPVLVLDEPTLGLDVLTNQLILKFIADAGGRGHTIILSTHHLDEVEGICQRFGLIHKGRMLAEGTLAQLQEHAGRPRLSDIFRALVEREDGPLLPESILAGSEGQPGPAQA